MNIIENIDSLQELIHSYKSKGLTIGFVPTMGALHNGHKALILEANKRADIVVVSIFVNPTQFGPNEDFDRYPKSFEQDKNICKNLNVSILFTPTGSEIYRSKQITSVKVPIWSDILCGGSRPQFFEGITTVLIRLFNIVTPDIAIFGEKDFQQMLIVRKMVHDLFLPISIISVPIVREQNGLAISSRNQYLSPEDRDIASSIFKGLTRIKKAFTGGEDRLSVLFDIFHHNLHPNIELDYLECIDSETLSVHNLAVHKNDRVVFAGMLNGTRLIDNIGL